MSASYIIDSVIFIDHFNRINKATAWLDKNRNSYISVITRAEILAGTKKEELHDVIRLLDSYECISIDIKIGDLAGELRRQYKLKLPDALQAACAKLNNLKLVTRNTKDFSENMDFVKIPYKI